METRKKMSLALDPVKGLKGHRGAVSLNTAEITLSAILVFAII